jgi:5-carboxymethyl-2-hydroxymuconate isomerase
MILPAFEIIFNEFHHALFNIAGIKIENCKSKAVKLEDFYIGKGSDESGFIHVEVKFLEGRSMDIKSKIGKQIMEIIKRHFIDNLQNKDFQLTVEILDIQKTSYFKYPKGTLTY